jgi:hypothetical protein
MPARLAQSTTVWNTQRELSGRPKRFSHRLPGSVRFACWSSWRRPSSQAAPPCAGGATEHRDALLLALAEHAHDAFFEVQLRQFHARAFADAAAGRIEHLDDGAVALALRRLTECLPEQQIDFGRREEVRHAARRFGALQQLGRVLLHAATFLQPAEQAAQARELALHGRRDKALLLELDEIAAQQEARRLLGRAPVPLQPRGEGAQVATVGTQRGGTLLLLALQPVQELVDDLGHGR